MISLDQMVNQMVPGALVRFQIQVKFQREFKDTDIELERKVLRSWDNGRGFYLFLITSEICYSEIYYFESQEGIGGRLLPWDGYFYGIAVSAAHFDSFVEEVEKNGPGDVWVHGNTELRSKVLEIK